jgi:L-asparaginase/Glu-tRNA(Gln) amidotransferase subunit D
MSNINLETLFPVPEATEAESSAIASRLSTQQPAFKLEKDCLAILAFGGTIQSAYIPADENIRPVSMNPVLLRLEELQQRFRIATTNTTGSTLIAKDSRAISNADLVTLFHLIAFIPNNRVLVSCGTYMLPLIAQALARKFGQGKSEKIIGITGSWLPPSQEGQDVDVNIGGTVAAINAFALAERKGVVFAQFHGEIFLEPRLSTLNLHPEGVSPVFKRKYVEAQ